MFETAELGQRLSIEEYERRVPELRTELLKLQARLEEAGAPVIILLHGVDGGGRTELLHVLHEWLDTRYLVTTGHGEPTEEERERPRFYRFWMRVPPRGRIGIYHGSWYSDPVLSRVYGRMSESRFDRELSRIADYERMLIDDGALILKFWFHISKKEQAKRLKELEKSKRTRWRVTKQNWKNHARYDEFIRVCARTLRETSNGESPWIVVEGTDRRFLEVTVANHIAERLARFLSIPPASPRSVQPEGDAENAMTILDGLDLARTTPKDTYEKKLPLLQGRLNRLAQKLGDCERSAIFMFEGWDAAGKGGAIRRITQALDPRQYSVIPVAAPTDEEKARHYLWRFWRNLPRRGHVAIYDRSWYGRVLVERIEGFARESEWRRAYKEINDFEEQLCEAGIVLVKFWLHMSSEEQLRRFDTRRAEPWKQHKITTEDYRNRAKTNRYEIAASEMIERTSTEHSPWTLVEAEDKRTARLRVLETVCERLEGAV